MTLFLFFFNDTPTTEIYTLSLHDALPISPGGAGAVSPGDDVQFGRAPRAAGRRAQLPVVHAAAPVLEGRPSRRPDPVPPRGRGGPGAGVRPLRARARPGRAGGPRVRGNRRQRPRRLSRAGPVARAAHVAGPALRLDAPRSRRRRSPAGPAGSAHGGNRDPPRVEGNPPRRERGEEGARGCRRS